MSGLAPPPHWPADPDHREAIGTLLTMADAEVRWGETRRAIALLDNAERIVGVLPQPYDRMLSRCRRSGSSRLND